VIDNTFAAKSRGGLNRNGWSSDPKAPQIRAGLSALVQRDGCRQNAAISIVLSCLDLIVPGAKSAWFGPFMLGIAVFATSIEGSLTR